MSPPNSHGETLMPIVMGLGGGTLGCLGLRAEPPGGVSALSKDPRWHWFPSRERAKEAGTPDGTARLQSLGSRTPGAFCRWCKTGDRPCTRPPCRHRGACHRQPRHAPHSCSCALRSAPNAEQPYPFRTLIRPPGLESPTQQSPATHLQVNSHTRSSRRPTL